MAIVVCDINLTTAHILRGSTHLVYIYHDGGRTFTLLMNGYTKGYCMYMIEQCGSG